MLAASKLVLHQHSDPYSTPNQACGLGYRGTLLKCHAVLSNRLAGQHRLGCIIGKAALILVALVDGCKRFVEVVLIFYTFSLMPAPRISAGFPAQGILHPDSGVGASCCLQLGRAVQVERVWLGMPLEESRFVKMEKSVSQESNS